MLEFKIIKHPDQLKEKLKSFDPQKSTWIVSDLKSKQDLQDLCLQKDGYFSDESILRISDFWKMWLRRLAPQIKIVSDDFIQILVAKFIDQYGSAIELKKNDTTTLFHYVTELAPLLLHKQSQESLKEWLHEKNPKPSWIEWEYKAQACVKYIVEEHLCLSSHWIVSYLQTLHLEKIIWSRNIIVDLGSQMTSLEMGVLNVLSKKNKIEIIVPDPEWKNQFSYTLRTYTDYIGYVKYEQLKSTMISKPLSADSFYRFNSEINEIKYITQKIRSWIEAGVLPQHIAILSPRLEDYWPVLKIHLEAEGILTQKSSVSKMISIGLIQRWLSLSQAQTEEIKWTNLELSYSALFENLKNNHTLMQDEHFLKYEKFKSLFYELIDAQDLNKSDTFNQHFYAKQPLGQILDRNRFLANMMLLWFQVDPYLKYHNILQNIVKDFIQNTTLIELSFSDWLSVLKARLAKNEIKFENSSVEGIAVLPLNSARTLNLTHKIWFGLDDAGLRGRPNHVLPLEDIAELKKIFDLAIEYPEESYADFNLRWYSMCDVVEQVFTCAHVSMKADPLNYSLFFLENNKYPQQPILEQTVIDNEQVCFDKSENIKIEKKIDLESFAHLIDISFLPLTSISPSDLETYHTCSFKFLARKGFKLSLLDNDGYEIENRQRGNMIHELFQYIINEKNYIHLTEETISKKIEELREVKGLFKNLDVFWKPQKDKLIKVAQQFIDIEKNRLETIAQLKHLVELPVEIYFDMENAQFSIAKPDGKSYLIKGRLDRVDFMTDQNQALIFDYKSNKNESITYANKWIESSQFQLLIYSIAIEKIYGVEVVGALYYFYKTFKHNYGFVKTNANSFLNYVQYQKNTLLEVDKIQDLYKDFNLKISDILGCIEKNEFKIEPLKASHCDKCEWDKICRIKNRI